LSFIYGIFVMPFFRDLAMYFIGIVIGGVSISCGIATAIGFAVGRRLIGKKHRAVVSVLLVLVYLIAWSVYVFLFKLARPI
jgi:hypothetical protein